MHKLAVAILAFAPFLAAEDARCEPRVRVRALGVTPGILPTGPLNAITDVAGVSVGHTTVIQGDSVRTGVTVILPHSGNLFREKVPGAVFVGNGFGKLTGSTQVRELGEIESPIVLTSTLNVPRVADAILDSMLSLEGNSEVRSVNVLVGETNDGGLNDIRSRPVTRDHVLAAWKRAKGGPVEEGAVGAGTGTVAFGFKGGIGTSSRRLPETLGGYTVGVLVQSNFGGILTIDGVAVGEKLGGHYLEKELGKAAARGAGADHADGSIMIVIATDAPLDARNLERLAARAIMGLARTGAAGTNGSGDYAIAFSTHAALRIVHGSTGIIARPLLANDSTSPLFLAGIEATEEAIYNSLTMATTVTGSGKTIDALPLDRLRKLLQQRDARP